MRTIQTAIRAVVIIAILLIGAIRALPIVFRLLTKIERDPS